MGNYLSRDQILSGGFRKQDVEAFGGMVCVREMPADLVDKLIGEGLVTQVTDPATGKQTNQVDFSKVDFVEVASRCIVDPETGLPLFSQADLVELGGLGFSSIRVVAQTAMNMIGVDTSSEDADPN